MKKFENPSMEVVEFDIEDVVTTSVSSITPPPIGGDVGDNCIS